MTIVWNNCKTNKPKESKNYLCVILFTDKIYCHFNKGPYCFNGKSLAGYFDIDSHSITVLYWAEVPNPEEFKKDFPF